MKTVDMLTKPCPIPVIEAKKALAEPDSDGVVVLVDNIVAIQNLEKMAKGMGYVFSQMQQGEARYAVQILKGDTEAAPIPEQAAEVPARGPVSGHGLTVLITCDHMGRGSEELGRILIKGFIFSLTELPVSPENLLFLNGGVRLAAEGANTLEDLRRLEQKGTKIRVCGTCLNYYQLTEKLAAGEITDMYGIAAAIASAANTITL